jgi:transposase
VFLRHLARGYPDQQLHLIMDNHAAHKHPKVKAWLAANPRIQVHFTPTSGSWLNLVEVWFGIIERQAIHRGTFRSVRDLMIKIRQFIDGWNHRKHPFIWTKTADDILDKINRKRTSIPDHSVASGIRWISRRMGYATNWTPEGRPDLDRGGTGATAGVVAAVEVGAVAGFAVQDHLEVCRRFGQPDRGGPAGVLDRDGGQVAAPVRGETVGRIDR